jgi:hypothetical protein
LIDARLDLAREDIGAAELGLRAIVSEESEASPEALIFLVETKVASGEMIDQATVNTAEALAFEHQGTNLGDSLARTEILAEAGGKDFDEAFRKLAVLSEAHPNDYDRVPTDEAVSILVKIADDATFLRIVFGMDPVKYSNSLSREVQTLVAARLMELGFSSLARGFIDHEEPLDEVELLLLARAELMDGNPGAALQRLQGLHEPEAVRLRAEVLSTMGLHSSAALELSRTSDRVATAAAAWRAGDLAMASEFGTDRQKALIQPFLMTKPKVPIGEGASDPANAQGLAGDGPLALSRTLLEQSSATRARLSSMLAEFPLAPPISE